MNKKITAFLLAMMMLTLSACNNGNSDTKKDMAKEPEYLKKIEYSNLSDEKSQKELQSLMTAAGISADRQNHFFENVNEFNATVNKKHLTQGFEIIDLGTIKYNQGEMMEELMAKTGDYMGNNCRITSFGLFGDFVELDKNAPKKEDWIMTDMFVLSENPEAIKGGEVAMEEFKVLYSTIATEKTKDTSVHVKKVQEDWKNREIKFKKDDKVSMISVFFYDDLSETPNLFIGHIGLLFTKSANELYFVEKVAFTEPYQMIRFNNRYELNDYLMNKYDVDQTPEGVKPFIMENDELLSGYRANPNNPVK